MRKFRMYCSDSPDIRPNRTRSWYLTDENESHYEIGNAEPVSKCVPLTVDE